MAQTNLSNLVAAASWSAPALWRFGRGETSGQKSGRGLPQSKTQRGFGRWNFPIAGAAGVETKMNMAQTNLSRRDSLKIARRFNAGIGLDCASSPGGTAENARPFRPSLRDKIPAWQTNLSKRVGDVVGRVTPCAPSLACVRRAEDCPPYLGLARSRQRPGVRQPSGALAGVRRSDRKAVPTHRDRSPRPKGASDDRIFPSRVRWELITINS